jgi:hypothetical protein
VSHGGDGKHHFMDRLYSYPQNFPTISPMGFFFFNSCTERLTAPKRGPYYRYHHHKISASVVPSRKFKKTVVDQDDDDSLGSSKLSEEFTFYLSKHILTCNYTGTNILLLLTLD